MSARPRQPAPCGWQHLCAPLALLLLLIMLGTGAALAADSGPRRHAEGAYDVVAGIYEVAAYDELAAIAGRLGITVAELRQVSGLTSDLIEPGQTLVTGAGTTPPPATGQYRMTTPIAPGVATPDTLDTSIGTLHLRDGFPKPDTVATIYDNLDRSRALHAYLLGIPIVNQAGMRDSLRKFGPDNQTDVIWETLVDPKTVELTANNNTIYNFIWIDTHAGPVVMEIPPMSLGLIDDFWYRWVADVGITGADHGKGGKYLILPPGHTGEVPEGFFVIRPSTYGNWVPFRTFLVDGSPTPGVESIKQHLKIYPLADAANPAPVQFANASGVPANFVAPGDYQFWELLDKVIQEEPSTGADPTTLGLFASIGIEKGKPFNPDARMKNILTDCAAPGRVRTAHATGANLIQHNPTKHGRQRHHDPRLSGLSAAASMAALRNRPGGRGLALFRQPSSRR